MKKLKFTQLINAPRNKVWDTLWNDETYRAWTRAFNESSYAESDWNEGSKIRFLSNNGEGMHSVIDTKRPNEEMTFRHLGEVKDFKELPVDENKSWYGALESYRLKDVNGQTELSVEMDIEEDYQDYFEKSFPQALGKVKELSEA
jgi:uncharacterized protein YndB with AHSA1/START domain